MILGIDVGGTTVKLGLVTVEGNILSKRVYKTIGWIEGKGFVHGLIAAIHTFLKEFPAVKRIGIGLPGIISKDRREIIFVQNIQSLNNTPLYELLTNEFPNLYIKIENDSNCAALGEFVFGDHKGLDNFILITLGTGVGCGAVIDQKLFTGARGNGLEFGDVLLDEYTTLESKIGISSLITYTRALLEDNTQQSVLKEKEINPKTIYESAIEGDKIALGVYKYLGKNLGHSLVSAIRILDVANIIIGGGISGAFSLIEPEVRDVLTSHLHPYYINDLSILKASTRNEAGILGAGSLVMRI